MTFEAHLPPAVQDDMSAVEIDELMMVHARVRQMVAEERDANG